MLMERLAARVAWISGATSGIGEAAARLFAQEAPAWPWSAGASTPPGIAEQIRAAGGKPWRPVRRGPEEDIRAVHRGHREALRRPEHRGE